MPKTIISKMHGKAKEAKQVIKTIVKSETGLDLPDPIDPVELLDPKKKKDPEAKEKDPPAEKKSFMDRYREKNKKKDPEAKVKESTFEKYKAKFAKK